MTVSRNILRPSDKESMELLLETEGVKSIAPLDCYLGIAGLPFKMSVDVMLECAYWAQNQCSYQAAEDVLRNVRRLDINDDTIRCVADYVGRLVFEEDCRRADEAYQKLDTGRLEFSHGRKGVLYIEADGAALNTRHMDEEGSTWRENKLGIVFSSDDIYYWKGKDGRKEHQVRRREYTSYIGNACEFRKHLLACALNNGYGDYEETVLLSDGAAWIAGVAAEIFPDAQHILDYFHLCENVYSYAKSRFHMEKDKYTPWAEEICRKLRAGKSDEVLKSLDPDEQYDGTVNLYHYIETHRDNMNYPAYEEKGYFIGSGAIESGNKVVLQKRLKQAGMRWNPETAQYLLTLKSKAESRLWRKDVIQYVYKLMLGQEM